METLRLDTPEGGGDLGHLHSGTRVGRYVVLEHVGAGGMGDVYEAYDPQLDRRIALKLLASGRRRGLEERLLREAKAMAQLSHPNVVPVYDAGESHQGIFIAMAFVAGQTLDAWLDEGRRPWRDVVNVFIGAARGLGCAHAAGIVHRDFKPDNVLLDDAGRPQVTDFGLARASTDPHGTPSHGSPSALQGLNLTRDGVLVGTPHYMAAEQMRPGGQVDARSDIFAFSVSLFRALYRTAPFPTDTLEILRDAVVAGRVTEPPGAGTIPRRVRQIMLRGLRPDPAQRPQSMDEVIAELEGALRPGRRLALGLGGALVAGAALFVGLRASGPPAVSCAGGPARAAEVWNPGVRSRLEAAGRAGGLTPEQQANNARSFDGYLGDWTSAYRESCEATHVRHEQTPAVLDLRMACLERQRGEARALVEILLTADPARLNGAASAVAGLGRPSACAEIETLLAGPPPASDPAVRARLAALETEAARVSSLVLVDLVAGTVEASERLVAEARAVGDLPFLARSLSLLASAHLRRRDGKLAIPPAAEALRLGERSHDARRSLLAYIDLLQAYRYAEERESARALSLAAIAAAERVGDRRLHADVMEETALSAAKDHPDEAERLIGEAIALREQQPTEMSRDVPGTYQLPWTYVSGAVISRFHHQDKALSYAWLALRRAAELHDPRTAFFHRYVSWILLEQGRPEEARAVLSVGLAIAEGRFGRGSNEAHQVETDLATIEVETENYVSAAARLERSLAAVRATRRDVTIYSTTVRMYLGQALLGMGRFDEAAAIYDEGRTVLAEHFPGDKSMRAELELGAADVERARGRSADALACLARIDGLAQGGTVEPMTLARAAALRAAVACSAGRTADLTALEAALVTMRATQPNNTWTADAEETLGDCQNVARQPAAAIAAYERALEIRRATHAPRTLARTREALARARAAARTR